MQSKLRPTEFVDCEDTFFSELYLKLKKYCHFLTQSEWDGDDIAQETMIKALKHYDITRDMSSALLNKMAYHNWIDTVRKRKREVLENTNLDKIQEDNDVSQLMDTIQSLLSKLTPKQAVIFTLKEAFQFKGKEIADVLGMKEVAIKAALHRVKNRLEKEDCSISDSFWEAEEKEQLSEVLYESMKAEDPFILIKALPSIPSFRQEVNQPKLVLYTKKLTSTPSSAYCMAA
ncbi:sigma-70 family RNA polymerase sigma factor [Bacillus sp. 31A1R]|uniref:Sigma-70 family RNA polymerase sigma factor n=1 Tax=Robertmurraya mangrovi TaxID=3098077 RepID=A0ABU5J2S0_9BACI|nr:sigma-70 family RNA polymerase sigma factor [Bacillus sp. 31A1R]MDZ5473714.1 sigma-70 family RNA polymerase sigma factor [Bacillus sp. 31A1R]